MRLSCRLLLRSQVPRSDATSYPKDGMTVRVHYETMVSKLARRLRQASSSAAIANQSAASFRGRSAQIEGENLKIDSSRDRKVPLEFRVGLGQVIPGLDVAMKRMSRGQRAKLTIPAAMAYGARGYPPIIPPGASLIMDVELISFA